MQFQWRGLAVVVVLAAMGSPAVGKTFYVDNNPQHHGSDQEPGDTRRPFLTIGKAAVVAGPGDTVLVRAGTYRETARPVNSGTAGAPITFQPEGNAVVTLNGTTAVTGPWTAAGGGLYYTTWPGAYVSANNQGDDVFLDGQMINVARWPEETNHDLSHPHTGIIADNVSTTKTDQHEPGPGYEIWDTVIHDPNFDEPDGRWKGAQVWVNTGGATDSQDGDAITGVVLDTSRANHTLTIEVPATGPIGKAVMDYSKDYRFGTGSHYYLFNPPSPEGVEFPGEWWHDTRNNRLYLRTPDGADPGRHIVEVKQRDWAFDLDGKSYVTVRGFHLFGCSITTDDAAGTGKGNGGNRTGIAPANHLLLDGLKARYVTHFTDLSGNLQTQWGQSSGIIVSGSDNVIRNCEIGWSSGSGFCLMGRDSLGLNNLVHDVVYAVTDCGGISLGAQYSGGDSLDNRLAYNTVYNVGVDGIEFCDLKNSDPNRPGVARIDHNVVHDAVLQMADSACMHEVGRDGQWVRLDHNIVYNAGGPDQRTGIYSGIYLDFAPDNGNKPGRYVVDHNIIYNCAMPLEVNGPNTDLFANNTLFDTSAHQGPIQSVGGGWWDTIVRNNLANDPFKTVQSPPAIQDHNITDATDALFADAANPDPSRRDFTLRPTATAAILQGAPTFYSEGPTPDIGARNAGDAWTAGYDLARKVIPPEAPVAPIVPVVLGAAAVGKNIFPAGDFEHLDPAGRAFTWNWTRLGNVSLAQEPDGNHYLRITHKLADRAVQATTSVPLDPSWKSLKISARMRVHGLKMGPAPNLTAAIVLRWMDKEDKLIGYAPSLALTADTDWKTLSETTNIPPGADHLNVEVSNIGAGGDFGADDITMIPSLTAGG